MPRASSVAAVVGARAATSVPFGTSMRAAAARLVTNSSAALRAPICRSSGQSCHWCSMQGSASAAKPCRRSWMTTLSACGCDLVMSQVKDKVTTPSRMLAPGNRARPRRDTTVTDSRVAGRRLSVDSTGVYPSMHSRERFLAALRGDALDRPPVWLMRQGARSLPGYRALRAEHSFWDVCQTPELSTRAALEPLDRYALDAAIG